MVCPKPTGNKQLRRETGQAARAPLIRHRLGDPRSQPLTVREETPRPSQGGRALQAQCVMSRAILGPLLRAQESRHIGPGAGTTCQILPS